MDVDVEGVIKEGEGQELEFKRSLAERKEILETISAFANSNGGRIFIGIEENKDGSVKEIVGIKIRGREIENMSNDIKQNTDSVVYPSIEVKEIEGKPVLVVEVKESPLKPVFVKIGGIPVAFKRVGKTNQKMDANELRRVISEGREFLWDSQVCEEASLDDIDEEKVKWFLRKAKYERNFDVDPETPVDEALERLELMKEEQLTNAAVLLFGKKPQRFFLKAKTRCARFKGTEPLEFIDMKVFGGNVIDQRDDALGFVKEHIKLHAKIVGTERKEDWEYPIEAVREAISNAICHRDYEISSNVQIRIFDDRLEVWGCGPLPKPLRVEDLKRKHPSVLRNDLIGSCFFLIKFIEEWGTGTNRIINECLNHGLPEPLFELIAENLVVTFRKYKITEDVLKELNERQKKAIDFLKERGMITNKDLQKLCPGVTRETLRKDLKAMIGKKIITKKGRKRGVYYELI